MLILEVISSKGLAAKEKQYIKKRFPMHFTVMVSLVVRYSQTVSVPLALHCLETVKHVG